MVKYNSNPKTTINILYNKTKKFLVGKQKVDWISGTSVANHLIKDPVIDWLNLYHSKIGLNNTRITRNSIKNSVKNPIKKLKNVIRHQKSKSSKDILFKNGLLFEAEIYNLLEEKFTTEFVNLKAKDRNNDEFESTCSAIENKIPIICQAYLKSEKLRWDGVADLLVRSDFINQITGFNVLEDDEILDTNNNLYYVVVDIKWSHITLCVDGKTIRNSGRARAYKGQLLIYNTILGDIQGFIPTKAYILPKSWNINNDKPIYTLLTRLGVVDFVKRDNEYVPKTIEAINWVRNVRENGSGWTPLAPAMKEMCCNACNQDDSWSNVKSDILAQTHDVTQVWMLSADHRDLLFDRGIKRWDQQFDLDFLKDGKRRKIIKNILDVNKPDCNVGVIFDKLDNRLGWIAPSMNDLFVDYETISNEFVEFGTSNLKDTFIFMIGVMNADNFTSFTCDEYQSSDEYQIMQSFKNFVQSKIDKHPTQPVRIFHWGCVERTLFSDFCDRYNVNWKLTFDNVVWIDMYEIFTNSAIAVKGALCYKLKEIAKAMHKLGIVKTVWVSDGVSNGLSAMMDAIEYYNETKNNTKMENIRHYNKIDCTVLSEIVTYLRIFA